MPRMKKVKKAPLMEFGEPNYEGGSSHSKVGKFCVDLDTRTGDVFVTVVKKTNLPPRKTVPWVRLVLDSHQLRDLIAALTDASENLREHAHV